MQMAKIDTIKVHPAIGIARLGNSPRGFFVGPEKPGVYTPARRGYRDAQGRIKHQAARFRLFGYDKDRKLIGEITAQDADITWSVNLANKKAEWVQFQGRQSVTDQTLRRNPTVADRDSLIISPGPRSLNGASKSASFDTGTFLGTPVHLGDIRSDNYGRLLVLGGFGKSGSPDNMPLTEFANNDGWYDDVSDGPVTATVKLNNNGQIIKAVGGWVICAAPKFAPPIENVITLYDTLLQVAVDKLGLVLASKPSFTNDIYPLLQRAMNIKWVSGMAAHPGAHEDEEEALDAVHHGGVEEPAHSTLAAIIPPPGSTEAREAIFGKLRDPSLPGEESGGESDMPMIHSDFYPAESNQPLTRIQYGNLEKWKDGNFINDWTGPPVPSQLITPAGLDRAALESCVGGAFYPGFEAGWMLRDTYEYSEPFRLDPAHLNPGDVTKQMALPWQADFTECGQEGELAWWPAQRPDEVFPEAGGPQTAWTRDLVESMEDMVQRWHRLGFIVKKSSMGDTMYVETERDP
jgi:hypothetical protein